MAEWTIDPCSEWVREAGRRYVLGEPPMAEQTIVQGQRTIARHPETSTDHRWWGTIDAAGYRERVWKAPDPESVEQQMNQTCGKVDTEQYAVTE